MHKLLNLLYITEFRYRVGTNYPAILEGYYKIGDYWDADKSKEARQFDQEYFKKVNNENNKKE